MRERSLLDRVVKAARLFDAYGGLLTPKQREVLELHYFQDLSLGEIAGHWDTSRQAVYDLARRALRHLEDYEEKLGLVARASAAGARWERMSDSARSLEQALVGAGQALKQGDGELARRELDRALIALEGLREGILRRED
ncbi:MAG: YlxM family DNA-binding protein [bacterium]|nr:YlxM family DNA-binding protein [bacterium]